MSVVVDANALVVLTVDRRRAPAVESLLRDWRDAGETVHAPSLPPYEVASALARSVAAGQLPAEHVETAWDLIAADPIELHDLEDGPAVVAMTLRLKRKSAYDAASILLADRLSSELWALDARLGATPTSAGCRCD